MLKNSESSLSHGIFTGVNVLQNCRKHDFLIQFISQYSEKARFLLLIYHYEHNSVLKLKPSSLVILNICICF